MQIINSPLSSAINSALHAVTDPFVGAGGAFNPSSLFGPADGGGVIDIGVMSSCFQDDAGTVVVTAVGQVVRSVRAVNRPTFLMVLDPDNLEATYELDPQGFPALKAAPSAESRNWAYYLKGDGGLPLTDWSIVMSALGTYGSGLNVGVGTGWSLFGNSTGDYGEPYEYAGLYTVQPAGDRAEILSTLDEGTQTFPVVENIDGRPYVYSTRSAAGEVDYQVNLEPVIETPNGVAGYPAPVGIKFWISPDDYWYGGVFITRYLSNNENLDTQIWCGDLAGITLAPLFNPIDLFLPGDVGGFITSTDMASLFQTRTGPTVPVTADGQAADFAVNQNPGAPSFARTIGAGIAGYVYEGGLLRGADITTASQLNTATPGDLFAQMTMVTTCLLQEPGGPSTSGNLQCASLWCQNSIAFGGANVRMQASATRDVRMFMQNWVPPDQGLNAQFDVPNVDRTVPHVFGARWNTNATEQYFFFDDVEQSPTLAYAPLNGSAPASVHFRAQSNTAAGLVSYVPGIFYINRWLTDTELAQLKTWMLENTPTP